MVRERYTAVWLVSVWTCQLLFDVSRIWNRLDDAHFTIASSVKT